MDEWCALYGSQRGTVIVYGVADEAALLDAHATVSATSRTIMWREPDLDNQATAFVTDAGRMELPLLGSPQTRRAA